MQPRRWLWAAAAVVWAAQIYALSASPVLTSDHTRSWLGALLETWFHWQAAPATLRLLGTLLRKGAHLTEYAGLAFLVYRALDGLCRTRARQLAWCVGIAAAYALSDEVHQSFVAGRGSSAVDWAIDTTGAGLAAFTLSRISRRAAH